MKTELASITPKEMIPGFKGRFVHGANFTLAYWEIKAGSILPEHSHIHEQSSQVIEGEFELTIDGKTAVYEPGAVVIIPSNVPHGGRAITDCKLTDVFSPVRPEYNNNG